MRNAAVAAALGLVAAALLGGGGSGSSRLLWIGGLALVAAAGAYWLLGARPSRAGVALLAALAGLVFWDGLSIVWSVAPDLSWNATNRVLVYLGFVFLGLAVAPNARTLALGLAAAFAAAVGWALLTKVFPGLYPDYGRIARLRSPVGYWNALAQVGDALLPLGLWLFGRRRAEGVVLAYAAVLAVVLTYSRTGVAFAAAAALLYLVLAREAVTGVGGLLCALAPAGAVLGIAAALPGVVGDGQPRSVRAHDGWIFALVALAGGAAAWALARRALRLRLSPPAGRRLVLAAAAIGAAAAVAGVTVLAVQAGGAAKLLEEFTNTPQQQLGQGAQRFASLNSSNRWSWWQESWAAFTRHPGDGSGAGSFPIEHRVVRTSYSQPAEEPHSLPLQVLGETGIVGFLLLAALVGAAVAIVRAALRRDDRPAVAALAAGCAAYLLHTLVDLHWDYLAVSAPVFLVLGALAGEPAPRRRGFLLPAAVALVAAAGVYSLASPYLASRKLDAVGAALDRGRVEAAYADARSAHRLNPLAIEPLVTEGYAARTFAAGEAALIRAVKLQPQNPDVWVALGEYELRAGNGRRAYDALNRAYTLDRYNPSAVAGGSLDRARCAVDPATC
ncbi:MAG TPA: O-antigen ligase family protein [Gaiellaceae bacterium]